MNDEYFMGQALRQAQTAFEKDEVPVGAVVVIDNKIISRGHNQVETLADPTAHASSAPARAMRASRMSRNVSEAART